MKPMRELAKPFPRSSEDWLAEIAADLDAREAIPFGDLLGEPFREADLFHWRPPWPSSFEAVRARHAAERVQTKLRLPATPQTSRRTQAFSNDPHLAFAFCYLASHYGLRLLTAECVEELMADIERNRKALARLIAGGVKSNTALRRTGARDARSNR